MTNLAAVLFGVFVGLVVAIIIDILAEEKEDNDEQ